MHWLTTLADRLSVTSDMVAVMVCVAVGALVLTNYTRMRGIVGFAMNTLALFAGAELANYLGTDLELPVDYVIERTLLVTIAGMLATSLFILLLFPRSRQG